MERAIAPAVSEPTHFLAMKAEPLRGTRRAGRPGTQSSQTGRAPSCPGHGPRSRCWEPPAHPRGAPERGWDWGESASRSSCPFPDPPRCRAGDAAVERQRDSTGETGGCPPKSSTRFTRAAKACLKIKRRRVKTCTHVAAVGKA